MTIEFPVRIVGGPYDGLVTRYQGETATANWRVQMALLEMDGHTYKLIEWDGDVAVFGW